jgi:hypothetical protein
VREPVREYGIVFDNEYAHGQERYGPAPVIAVGSARGIVAFFGFLQPFSGMRQCRDSKVAERKRLILSTDAGTMAALATALEEEDAGSCLT